MVLGGVIKYNLMEKNKLHKESHRIHKHNLGIRTDNHQHTLKLQRMERAAELAQDQREQEHKHQQFARQQEMNHEKELADIRRKEAEAKAKAQIAKSQALLKTAAENKQAIKDHSNPKGQIMYKEHLNKNQTAKSAVFKNPVPTTPK